MNAVITRDTTPRATAKTVWAVVTIPTLPPVRAPGGPVASRLRGVSQTDDPVVSAVVTLREDEAGGPTQETTARIKAHVGAVGFEVPAPRFSTFSLGGRQSLIEEGFGEQLLVDNESLATTVTTADGRYDLSLAQLPEEVRSEVVSVAFMPPPGFG